MATRKIKNSDVGIILPLQVREHGEWKQVGDFHITAVRPGGINGRIAGTNYLSAFNRGDVRVIMRSRLDGIPPLLTGPLEPEKS